MQAGALPFLRSLRPRGGKMDDITVLVGFMQQADARPDMTPSRDDSSLAIAGGN